MTPQPPPKRRTPGTRDRTGYYKVPIDPRWMRLLWARRVAEGGPKNGAPGGASISRLVNRALERFFGIRLQDLQSDDQWKPRTGIPKDAQDQTEANNPPPPP